MRAQVSLTPKAGLFALPLALESFVFLKDSNPLLQFSATLAALNGQ